MVEKDGTRRTASAAEAQARLAASGAPAAPAGHPETARTSLVSSRAPAEGPSRRSQSRRRRWPAWAMGGMVLSAVVAWVVMSRVWPQHIVVPPGPNHAHAVADTTPLVPPAVPSPETGQATLVFETKEACVIRLDGEPQGTARPGTPLRAVAAVGIEHLVHAVTADGREWSETVTPRNTMECLVRVALKEKLGLPLADAKLRPAPDGPPAAPGRIPAGVAMAMKFRSLPPEPVAERRETLTFKPLAPESAGETGEQRAARLWRSGIVERGGLMWTIKDNDSDVNWFEARDYCTRCRLGGYTDWRLPTIDELTSLYDPARPTTPRIVVPFEPVFFWMWSSTMKASANGSASAFCFNFGNGVRDSFDLRRYGMHVLCVRQSGE
jgi:hypothetical protein